MFKIIPILMGVVLHTLVAAVMTAAGITNPDGTAIIDFAAISKCRWF